MKIERIIKPAFSVIGKEGSTADGPGFIQRLWADANGHFAQVQHLAKKDERGQLVGVWGAMTDPGRSFLPWEDGFTRGLYLAGVECEAGAQPPKGWTKWNIPGYAYLRAESAEDVFGRVLALLDAMGLSLAGAVHDFTAPGTGKSYMYFPVRRMAEGPAVRFRRAGAEDAEAATALYEAVHDAEDEGRTATGWKRGVYPTAGTVRDALNRQDLYVEEAGGRIVAAAIINGIQAPAYEACPWTYPAEPEDVLVLHTLAVHPDCVGRGYARAFVRFYEDCAWERGCSVLRMDTQQGNAPARKLYASLGYREAGVVPTVFNGIPGVQLVCLEKQA